MRLVVLPRFVCRFFFAWCFEWVHLFGIIRMKKLKTKVKVWLQLCCITRNLFVIFWSGFFAGKTFQYLIKVAMREQKQRRRGADRDRETLRLLRPCILFMVMFANALGCWQFDCLIFISFYFCFHSKVSSILFVVLRLRKSIRIANQLCKCALALIYSFCNAIYFDIYIFNSHYFCFAVVFVCL